MKLHTTEWLELKYDDWCDSKGNLCLCDSGVKAMFIIPNSATHIQLVECDYKVE